MQKILKVKYCYSEEELNSFLETLPVEVFYLDEDKNKESTVSKLHNISYMPACNGGGTDEAVDYKTDIVAVVQYWEYK